MANNNNNNGNKRKNWFGMKRDQFGNDWLNRVQPNDIQNNCLRIIQDMATGNFDPNGQDMIDFCDSRVINAIIEYSDHKVAKLTEIVNGLVVLQSSDRCSANTPLVLESCNPSLQIYKNVKDSLEAYRLYGDITLFVTMLQNLRNFRNYIDLNRSL